MAGDSAGARLDAENVQAAHGALVAFAEFVRHYFFSTVFSQQTSRASAPFVTMNSDLHTLHVNLAPVGTVGIGYLVDGLAG